MRVSRLRAGIYAFIERLLLFNTSRVICVSDHEREAAIRYGLSGSKIIVVHNGVRDAEMRDFQDPYVCESGKLRILFVGRFHEAKGFDILLRAMSELTADDVHLTAVGAPDNSTAWPEAAVNVHLAGWQTGPALAAFYVHADVVVVPSRWEGFAMVPLEAMSYGKPLVASRVCSLPEVVCEGETGFLFEGESATDLVRVLRQLPRHQLPELGERGRSRFRQHFRSAVMASKTKEIYLEVME